MESSVTNVNVAHNSTFEFFGVRHHDAAFYPRSHSSGITMPPPIHKVVSGGMRWGCFDAAGIMLPS